MFNRHGIYDVNFKAIKIAWYRCTCEIMYSVIVQVFTIGMHFLITLNIRQIHYEHFLGISFDSYIQVLLGTPYSRNIDLVTIFTSKYFFNQALQFKFTYLSIYLFMHLNFNNFILLNLFDEKLHSSLKKLFLCTSFYRPAFN